jgi:hypothetical protein
LIPLVQYVEASSAGYSSSAFSRSDSFFVVLTEGGIGKQPTGPKDVLQTILVRATGIGTAPCDYACRVWVQNPDGRLRIAASDETMVPPTVERLPLSESYMNNNRALNTVKLIVGRGAPYESIEPPGSNRRNFVRVCLQNKSSLEVANIELDIVGLHPPNEGTFDFNLKSDITIGPHSERFVDVAYYDIDSSQAPSVRHIGLAVPRVGGYFAEAYSFASLPLTAHSFSLRLSRFSEVLDEISCRLFLDNQGLLKLESRLDSGRDKLEIKHRASPEAWLKPHLPNASEAAGQDDLPEPVANVESPWTYGWTTEATITIAAGPESLPFYPSFNSEQEHRQTLEVCWVGAEKLLKKLQAGRYHNVRQEYMERLEDYLQNLPKIAAAGNILLAYDEILNLRSDFAADVEILPTPFATDLKRVIENHFALTTFYDIVSRHNEAVASATRSTPYPSEAIEPLNEFVSANTPRLFEPSVSEAQRRLERAGPRDDEPTREASTSQGDSIVVQPPPLPPATPDATRAHQRQTAANTNALWEAFVKGPAAIEGWWQIAHQLGDLVKPFLDYLRG